MWSCLHFRQCGAAPTFWTLNHFRHELIHKSFRIFIQCSWEKLACEEILPHSILARAWHQNAAILREPAWARAIFSRWGPHYFFLKCLGRCTREDIWAQNCFSGKEVFNLSKKQNLFRFFYFLGQIWQLVVFEKFVHCSQIFTFLGVRLSWVRSWEHFNFLSVCTNTVLFVLVQFAFSFIPVASGVVDPHCPFWGYLQLL